MEIHVNKDFMRNRIDIYVYDNHGDKQRFYCPCEEGDTASSYRYVEINSDEIKSV